jgi:hypothetical protein
MPMEPPNVPFYRRWSFLLAGVIGLAGVVALLGWRGLQEVAEPAPTSATTVIPVPTTQAPTPTTAPPTSIEPTSKPDEILWERRNSGASKVRSQGFRAPSAWRIEWAFDCSNFGDHGGGPFKITGDGDFQLQIQIDRVAVHANGTKPLTRGGFGHLYVETVCEQWTVRALSS